MPMSSRHFFLKWVTPSLRASRIVTSTMSQHGSNGSGFGSSDGSAVFFGTGWGRPPPLGPEFGAVPLIPLGPEFGAVPLIPPGPAFGPPSGFVFGKAFIPGVGAKVPPSSGVGAAAPPLPAVGGGSGGFGQASSAPAPSGLSWFAQRAHTFVPYEQAMAAAPKATAVPRKLSENKLVDNSNGFGKWKTPTSSKASGGRRTSSRMSAVRAPSRLGASKYSADFDGLRLLLEAGGGEDANTVDLLKLDPGNA